MVNPRFDEIKIGFANDVEERRRTLSTGTPDPYHVYATYGTSVRLTDIKVRNIITELNPELHYNNEFFVMTPQSAYVLLENIAAINGLVDNLVFNPQNDEYIDNLPKVKRKKISKNEKKQDGKDVFYIKTMPSVTCVVNQDSDGKFQITLPKGTKIKEKALKECHSLAQKTRTDYEDSFDNKTFVTTKDIVFDAPAQPVKFVLGSNENGRNYLINKETGLSFAECYPK